MVWVTKGREVENYVDPIDLHEALKSIHSTIYKEPLETGRFDHAFYFKRTKKNKSKTDPYVHKDGDKVKAATLVCEKTAKLDTLDLNEKVEELVTMIRRANGLDDQ
ncbi:hypothetical protein [Ruegeria sp. HKCCD6157]|uniref:hypothetical protein n=1 Tax=Ruegeria sp. HKCCD6157 TaxID=2690707 RepID=UPI001491495E|nr:hypothetical protein [Ruegeria sp. HKCCD6157]NOE28351.1 hypothetical protein [Ruegeria sp. HKCCD6157]